MIDPTKKYRTRSGLPVRKVFYRGGTRYPWAAEVLENGDWTVKTYTKEGEWHRCHQNHGHDLIEIKEPEVKELDWTKPELLQRRDGGEWRLLATDAPGEQPIVIAVKSNSYNDWVIDGWSINGSYHNNETESEYDIIPKPRRVTGWCNAYGNEPDRALGPVYRTQEEAKQAALASVCVGQIYIDAEVQS